MTATIHPLMKPARRPASASVFDADLIRRLDRSGPRYTSYPSADRFHEGYTAAMHARCASRRGRGGLSRALSIYVHVPFCGMVCFYCGCNKVVTRDRSKAARYLQYLTREIDLHAGLLGEGPRVEQLHFGGGTPTYLDPEQIGEIVTQLRGRFDFGPDFEGSIEIDPRTVDAQTIAALSEHGFRRLSLGVQDFAPEVQRAINRIQSEEQTAAVMRAGRACGFGSINVDLIYGLPRQTLASIADTLDRVIALGADRIAFYNYAHLPVLFKPQRRILEADLPSAEAKLEMLGEAISRLTSAGYLHIGMDHFARPEDELAVAQRQGRLHRNFQGYSTHADCDLVGMGASAIGMLGTTYYQNHRALADYYRELDAGELPVMRGYEMTHDDLVRRSVIQSLMCHFEVCKESVEVSWLIDFDRYFEQELTDLVQMQAEGLVELDGDWIAVTPRGRLLVRSIGMVFDRHLRVDRDRARYSKVI